MQSSPHLTQDTNWKVTPSQLDITNESQEVSPSKQGTTRLNKQTRTKAYEKQDRKMSFKCDRDPIFQVTNLNSNLTQFRHSAIHCQPDPTERNCSIRRVTNNICVDRLEMQSKKAGFSSGQD